ncbi:hypothetical protein, conserved [Babesia bigemina]|uniref:Tubulin binding cofactor C-like domain-containing protein n=1 Tax=Babesia bigemina TaxID=5866 RepID=A0A061DAU8_BABBI|nr:hypothetical protein, conserved [Babesia bigemina]CDR97683.1 hypothetical protein, conserved [Babesia bigemina]|eukprot:XP_012769869.1 hypothetical protein, conserved [Babesia bigemina]
MLQNATRTLEGRQQAAPVRSTFSFKPVRSRQTAAASDAAPSVPPAETSGTASVARPEPKSGVSVENGTLRIQGLSGIDVVRCGAELHGIGTVMMRDLDIRIGVARGSAILHSLCASTMLICCRQLRIANSVGSKFLTDTVTMPIIER